MYNKLQQFKAREDGAVTVDWVVLTAGIAMLGAAIVATIQTATQDATNGIEQSIIRDGTRLLNNGDAPN